MWVFLDRCFSSTYDQSMGLQALMNVGYVHAIYKFINCSWTAVGWMAAVGKSPHFLQKNPPAEFSGYGPAIYVWYQPSIDSHGIHLRHWIIPAHLLILLKSTGVSVEPIRPLSVSHSCFTHTYNYTEMRSVVATKTMAMP